MDKQHIVVTKSQVRQALSTRVPGKRNYFLITPAQRTWLAEFFTVLQRGWVSNGAFMITPKYKPRLTNLQGKFYRYFWKIDDSLKDLHDSFLKVTRVDKTGKFDLWTYLTVMYGEFMRTLNIVGYPALTEE